METLECYFEELEQIYGSFVSTASDVACYASEHPEIDYNGSLSVFDLELTDYEADKRLEKGLVEAQNLSIKIHDNIQKLSKEIKVYRERKDKKPDKYFHLADRFSNLMRQFDQSEEPGIDKQKSIIGTMEAEKLVGQISYEPKN